jgi:hypothetical protein
MICILIQDIPEYSNQRSKIILMQMRDDMYDSVIKVKVTDSQPDTPLGVSETCREGGR